MITEILFTGSDRSTFNAGSNLVAHSVAEAIKEIVEGENEVDFLQHLQWIVENGLEATTNLAKENQEMRDKIEEMEENMTNISDEKESLEEQVEELENHGQDNLLDIQIMEEVDELMKNKNGVKLLQHLQELNRTPQLN